MKKMCALFLSVLLTLAGSPAWAEGEIVTGPDRRQEIDLRIEALDARRAAISTRGPKTATLLGLGSLVAGGIMLGVGMSCRDCEEEYYVEKVGLASVGGALAGIGVISALTGGIIWGVRVKRRNEIDAERELLIKEWNGLAATLSRLELGSPYRNGTQFVTLGVRF